MGELDPSKAAQGATWSEGDYQALGRRLMPVSERLCEAMDLRSSWTVLDAATGAGNTALAVARHGCQVTAVDVARRRARGRPGKGSKICWHPPSTP